MNFAGPSSFSSEERMSGSPESFRRQDFYTPSKTSYDRSGLTLQSCLSNVDICSKCYALESYLRDLSTKEELRPFYEFFPQLLVNVFGFDGKNGWINVANAPRDRDALRQLLRPNGVIFNVMLKLRLDSKLNYEFPCAKLPSPTQKLIADSEFGSLPPHYSTLGKLRFDADGRGPNFVVLDMLEYYFYCFAYFLSLGSVQSTPTGMGRKLFGSQQLTLYEVLLQDFLDYFLPVESSCSSGVGRDRVISPIGIREKVRSRNPFGGSANAVGGVGLSSGDSALFDTHVERHGFSEVFLNILMDFWLNQNQYEQLIVNPDSCGQNMAFLDYVHPTPDLLSSLCIVTRHLHRFFYGGLVSDSGGENEGLDSTYQSSTENPYSPFKKHLSNEPSANANSVSAQEKILLQRTIWHQYQAKLYKFLRLSTVLSSADASVEQVVDLWLTSISPWFSVKTNEMSYAGAGLKKGNWMDGSRSYNAIHGHWVSFVYENLLLYTVLFGDFFGKMLHFDWNILEDVEIACKIADFFCDDGLIEIIKRGVNLLNAESYSPGSDSKSVSGKQTNSMSASSSVIKVNVMNMERNRSVYFGSFFDRRPPNVVGELICSIRETKFNLEMLEKRKTQQEHSRTFLENVLAFFENEPVGTDSSSKKLIERLEFTQRQISKIFKIPFDSEARSNPDSTTSTRRNLNDEFSNIGKCSSSNITDPPDTLWGEDSPHLSPNGKRQIARGLRKCTNKNVPYIGDPVTQPIRSYENAFLVRKLNALSIYLNTKFELSGNQGEVRSSFHRSFPSSPSSELKFNLRVLASYPFQALMFLTLAMLWLISRIFW
eukprot:Nk52_evm33s2367 gene=Nk52_evmTU33s2367